MQTTVYREQIMSRTVSEDRGYASPCWIWKGSISANGYGQITVGPSGERRTKTVHRLRWEIDNGPIPEGLQLDHLCRQRSCVNPAHLELVTPLQNARRSRSAKLSDAEAREIYRRKLGGESTRTVAEAFAISRSTVNLIARQGPDGPRCPSQNARHREHHYPSKRTRRYDDREAA